MADSRRSTSSSRRWLSWMDLAHWVDGYCLISLRSLRGREESEVGSRFGVRGAVQCSVPGGDRKLALDYFNALPLRSEGGEEARRESSYSKPSHHLIPIPIPDTISTLLYRLFVEYLTVLRYDR